MRLRRSTVERPWGRLRVWHAGRGPTLLAVHGLGGSGRYFQELVDHVGDRFRVIAPDLAGFGGSDKPRTVPYDRAFHVESLDAVLAGGTVGGGEDVRVVGHSIGATIGAFWASTNVERVRGLAMLAAPYPTGDGGHAGMRDGRPSVRGAWRALALRLAVPVLSLPVGVLRGYRPAIAFDYGRQSLSARARTTWWALHDPQVARELQLLKANLAATPTLLVHAADDRTVRAGAQEAWAMLLGHADRRTVPGGHQIRIRSDAHPLIGWLDATLER